jgi:DNA-directed RNA polymerase I subunit RPA2
MIQKLYALVSGDCVPDNPDSPMHQEVLLGGHVYLSYFKEKLADYLIGAKTLILQDLRRNRLSVDFQDSTYTF